MLILKILSSAMVWMFVTTSQSPIAQITYVENLIPDMMVLRSGVFAQCFGGEDGTLWMGLVTL